jgi:hypothetical protein
MGGARVSGVGACGGDDAQLARLGSKNALGDGGRSLSEPVSV